MDISKRKQLRLRNFDYNKKNAYFITICTYNRAELFVENANHPVGAHLCVRPAYTIAEK